MSLALNEASVLQYEPLVGFIVRRMSQRLPAHIDRDDLHSSGVLGLLDAFEKFDPMKNVLFKTYAEYRIEGSIIDNLRVQDWVPRNVRQKGKLLDEAHKQTGQLLGREPEENEMADCLSVDIDEYHKMAQHGNAHALVSLGALGEGENSEGESMRAADIIADEKSPNPFEEMRGKESLGVLKTALGTLNHKERETLSLYYWGDRNMREIATLLGITEGRVSQLRTKALGKMRVALKKQKGNI